MQIDVIRSADPPGAEAVTAGLMAHFRDKTGDRPRFPVTLLLRNGACEVQGGIRAELALSWLHLDHFWIDDRLRGQGQGARLLARAEAVAREHGAIGVHLSTSTFQAVGFYEKHGYSEIGRLRDRPPGHDKVWMAKRFAVPSAP